MEPVLVGIRSGATGVGRLVRPGCYAVHPSTWVPCAGGGCSSPARAQLRVWDHLLRCLLAASSQLGVTGGGAVDSCLSPAPPLVDSEAAVPLATCGKSQKETGVRASGLGHLVGERTKWLTDMGAPGSPPGLGGVDA